MKSTAIVIMAKEPHPGSTKTRLVPALTFEQAATLYAALLRDTISLAADCNWADLVIAISPPKSSAYFERIIPQGTRLLPIEGIDIGDCLRQTLGLLLDAGYQKAIALNADGPSLPSEYLSSALSLLDEHDLVFGEGIDGGYYLVGVKKKHPAIFEGISWSTRAVLVQSLQKAVRAGLSVALTPAWYDIDTIADLQRLQAEIATLPPDQLLHTRRFFADFGSGPKNSHQSPGDRFC